MSRTALMAMAMLLAPFGIGGCARTPDAKRQQAGEQRGASHELQVSGPRHQVGFSRRVTLTASVTGGGSWTFTWRHLWGPVQHRGRGRLTSSMPPRQGASLELVTRPPPTRDQITSGEKVLALSAHQAGRVVLSVEARSASSGARLERTVEVIPAFPSAAWPRAAPGVDLYLSAGPWTTQQGRMQVSPTRFPHLSRARWPSATASVLTSEWNTLKHGRAGETELKVRSGPWIGHRDCGRFDCHPKEHRGWLSTAHASVFERGIEGRLSPPMGERGPFREHCLPCHTLGHQPGADNDGFDDRARASGWTFPKVLARGNWLHVPGAVKDRANVQCESCHGAGWYYTGYGDDICAQCHDHPPRYQKVAQLRRNKMVRSHRSLQATDLDDRRRACRDCHVGQDYLRSTRGHRSASKPVLEVEVPPRGVTCPVCHDPHSAGCDKQLRFCGEVEIPGRTFDAGKGALCISCHSGEANIVRGELLRPFVPGTTRRTGHARNPVVPREPNAAPHASQFQMLTGRGGKFLHLPKQAGPAKVYPHMQVPDTCVGCHVGDRKRPAGGHTFKLLPSPSVRPAASCPTDLDAQLARLKASSVTRTCSRCHGTLSNLDAKARGDYDGDRKVEGIVSEVEGLMRMLRGELERQIRALGLVGAGRARGASFAINREAVVVTDESCRPLRGAPALHPKAPHLYKAAHNYLMVLRDGSGGIHNPQYTVRLLQDAIEGLERARGAQTRHPWKRP